MFTVSRISETSNAVSLSTVPPVEPAIVDGGLAPGPTIFATILMFVSVIGWVLACTLRWVVVRAWGAIHPHICSNRRSQSPRTCRSDTTHHMIHTDIQQRSTFFCSAGDPSQHPLAAPPHRVARRLALLGQRAVGFD